MRIVLWAREKYSESSSRRPVSHHCDYYKILARHNHNNKRDLNTKQKKRAREGGGSGRKSVILLSCNYCQKNMFYVAISNKGSSVGC